MFNIIASSFFQKKYCQLPGIGSLTLKTRSAKADFVNAQILPPVDEIIFSPSSVSDSNTFNEFSAISELMKRQLNDDGQVDITGVGTFIKNAVNGSISFIPVQLETMFSIPVTAERVIRHDAEHTILVGDVETTNTAMTGFFSDKPEIKQRWWIWAAALGALGLALVLFYIYLYGFSNFGNVIKP